MESHNFQIMGLDQLIKLVLSLMYIPQCIRRELPFDALWVREGGHRGLCGLLRIRAMFGGGSHAIVIVSLVLVIALDIGRWWKKIFASGILRSLAVFEVFGTEGLIPMPKRYYHYFHDYRKKKKKALSLMSERTLDSYFTILYFKIPSCRVGKCPGPNWHGGGSQRRRSSASHPASSARPLLKHIFHIFI